MDEDKIQQNRRDQDEKATQERAAILGISYFDAREDEGPSSFELAPPTLVFYSNGIIAQLYR